MMRLPFSKEQFFGVFSAYNDAVWPFQIVAVLLALVILIAGRGPTRQRSIAVLLLASLWIWMGVVYHWFFFSPINPAARAFAALFAAQGLFLAWHGIRSRRAVAPARPALERASVAVLAAYAVVGYPLIGMLAGQRYPALPTFGLPCPTVIFTFAALIATDMPRSTYVIPAIWALISSSAAVTLGVVEDYALLPAALLAVTVTLLRRRRAAPNTAIQSR